MYWWMAVAASLAIGAVASDAHAAAGDENARQNFFRDDYAVDVDAFSGTFSTRVGIEVPPFRGIEPKLALSYSSNGRNGFVGVGWDLAGMSYIERVSPGKGAPTYTATDAYMLDGAELVPNCTLLGGTHCTRIQSYRQIKLVGSGTSATWQVRDKSGVLSTYTAQLRDSTTVFRWALSTVTDRRGNTVTYTYTTGSGACSGANAADCYPSTILYRNAGATADHASITFSSATRTDTLSFADGKTVRTSNRRLTDIDVRVLVGTTLTRARRYHLVYTASTDSARSLLTRVERYGSNNTTKYAQDVIAAYSNATEGTFATPISASGLTIDVGGQILTGDYNHDGLSDVFVIPPAGTTYYSWLSEGTGQYTRVTTTVSGSQPIPSQSEWFGGDFNGDGNSDVAQAGGGAGGLWIWFSDGDGTFTIGQASASISNPPNASAGPWSEADLDGDGKTDLVQIVGTTLYIWRSDGDLSFTVSTLVPPGSLGTLTGLGPWLTADVNGDGNTDLVWVKNINANIIYSFVSKGDFTFNVYQTAKESAAPAFGGKWRVADFNGDGKTDLFHVGTANAQLNVYASRGGPPTSPGFTRQTLAPGSGYPPTQGGWWFPIDLNGDGRSDLYHVASTGRIWRWISSGALYTYIKRSDPPPTGYPTVFGGRWQSGDLDGDARDDLIHIPATNQAYTWRATGNTGHRLSSIETPLGGVTSVQYQPSTAWTNDFLPVGMIQHTTSRITKDDGRASTANHIIDYEYEGGLWSSGERCFLGFHRVKKFLDAQGNYEESIALQSSTCATRPQFVYQRNAADQIFSQTEFEYAEQAATAPFSVLETGRWTQECNLDASCFATYTTTAYDTYANVTQTVEYGENLFVGDERTTTRQYFPNTTDYVVDRVAREFVTLGVTSAGPLVAETRSFYDGNALHTTPPTRGELTRSAAWDDVNGIFLNSDRGYDTYGNVTSEVTPRGFTTTTIYEATLRTFPAQICPPLITPCTVQTWNNLFGSVATETDPNGAVTTSGYDVLGRLTSVLHPNSTSTTYAYAGEGDPATQRVTVTEPDHTGGRTTISYFDGFGRNWQVVKEGGAMQLTDYHEASERVLRKSVWFKAPEVARYWDYTYDGAKRLTRVDEPGTPFTTTAYGDTTTSVAGVSRRTTFTTVTDPLGKQRTAYRDGFGRVVKVSEQLGASTYSTSFSHDALGNLIRVEDAALNLATFDYDSLSRLVASEDFDRGHAENTYDANGNLLTSRDAKNQTTTFTYDALDRKATKTNQAGGLTQWFYDEAGHGFGKGRLTRVVYGSGNESLSYDAMGQQTQGVRCVEGVCQTISQTYLHNRLATLQYPGAETLTYGYDAEGYLTSVGGYVTSIAHNARGQVTSMLYANGVATTVQYNNQYDLASNVRALAIDAVFYDASYTYNDSSQITNFDSLTGGSEQYNYDDLYRLTHITTGAPAAFAYDAIGNMTFNADNGAYVYAELGKPHAVSQAGAFQYEYDANGNMISVTTRAADCVQIARLLSWDTENRLAWVSAQGKTTRYGYSGDGERISKQGPSGTTYFYGKLLELADPVGTPVLTKYIYAGAQLVAKNEGGTKYWVNQDHVDSMAVLTEATFGNDVRRIRYEPFGQEASSTGSIASKQSFGSHYRDDESGLLFMGGRYYDAALSRFTQPDSIVPEPDDPQSWNRYSYTRNNPVNRIDPTGHADISTAGDVADAFDKKAGQATDILGDWVENSGGNVVVATATKTAIDLGKGLVDTLRLGQGAAEGGIGGIAHDALRAAGLAGGLAQGARALSSLARAATPANEAAQLVGAARGGAGPVRLGQIGEKLAGIRSPKTPISVNGRTRIPDELTATTLREIKNVKSLSLTAQIRDFVQFSQETGRAFALEVRQGTRLSGPLREAVDKGLIQLTGACRDAI